MKKAFKRFLALAVMSMVALSAVGCGKFVEEFDSSSTLLVTVYDGGFGTAWASNAAKEFNDAHPDAAYKIKINPLKIGASDVKGYLENETNISRGECAYFVAPGGEALTNMIKDGYLCDLTDVMETTISGETKTIGDKLNDYDVWHSAFSDRNGNGWYAMPHSDAIMGFIFNYDIFVKNGWLYFVDPTDAAALAELTAQGVGYTVSGDKLKFTNYTGDYKYFNMEEGDYITTAGRDGIYGSYDDGQPNTIEEFDEMVKIIDADGVNPFIFSGMYSSIYCISAYYSILADVNGKDAFETFYTMDSNGASVSLKDGRSTVITPANGYEVYNLEGIEKGIDFLYWYMNANNNATSTSGYKSTVHNYLHSACVIGGGTSHKDAQGYYLYAQAMGSTATNNASAMLYDGAWWENEARSIFDDLVKKYPDYAFGKQDFRMMLYPHYDSTTQGSAFSVFDNIVCMVPKKIHRDSVENENRLALIKEFVAYCYSDKILNDYVVETGNMRPYSFELSQENYNKMSKFAQSSWALYSDTENVTLVRPNISEYNIPLTLLENHYQMYVPKFNDVLNQGATSFLGFINNKQSDFGDNVAKALSDNMYDNAMDKWSDYYKN